MTSYYKLLQRTNHDSDNSIAYFHPTIHSQGVWNKDEQHMGAASGLITHELEKFMPRQNMRIARISFDIWGKINLADFSITTQLIRPGKTIELIEAKLQANNKTYINARAWRLAKIDTSTVAGIEDQPIHKPDECDPWLDLKGWPGGFIQSLEGRRDKKNRLGKGIIWLNTSLTCIADEPSSDFVHLITMVDMANGSAPRQAKPFAFAFPNVDLQLHMHRAPKGRWLGIQAVQQYGEDGIGITSSILHDIYGPFGRAEQILTLRPMKN